MAKWMNKMGLAAINFNMDDSRIGGFHKGFVDSREGSPASTPTMALSSTGLDKQQRAGHIGSIGDSENDSDKESVVSWHKSSLSDIEQPRDKVNQSSPSLKYMIFVFRMINERIYHRSLVMHVHPHRLQFYPIHIIVPLILHRIVSLVKSIKVIFERVVHPYDFLRYQLMMMIKKMPMSMQHRDYQIRIHLVNYPINECLQIIDQRIWEWLNLNREC